jgi:hypothetical protein
MMPDEKKREPPVPAGLRRLSLAAWALADQELRRLVLEIARVKPGKRNRWRALHEQHPDLYRRAVAVGLCTDRD